MVKKKIFVKKIQWLYTEPEYISLLLASSIIMSTFYVLSYNLLSPYTTDEWYWRLLTVAIVFILSYLINGKYPYKRKIYYVEV